MGAKEREQPVRGEVYQVYGNRTVGTFSFRSPRTSKVEAHSRGPFVLEGARFIVRPTSRDRVRASGHREVHAWVEGIFSPDRQLAGPAGWAYYNPFKTDGWIDIKTGKSLLELGAHTALFFFAEDGRPRVRYFMSEV